MKRVMTVAMAIPILAGCGGSFPKTATPGGVTTPTPRPTPTPAPGAGGTLDLSGGAPPGTIYYLSNDARTDSSSSVVQLYAARADGSGRTLVGRVPADADGSTTTAFHGMSPDGKWIAFGTTGSIFAHSTTMLYISKADGTSRRTLVAGDTVRGFAFSPDSQRVLYSGATAATGVVMENVDGSGKRVVAAEAAVPERTIASQIRGLDASHPKSLVKFSPDGQKIAYATENGLFVESAAGGGKVTLAPGSDFYALGFDFTPDGQKLAARLQHPSASKNGIYVLNADGSTNLNATAPILSGALFSSGDGFTSVYSWVALEGVTPGGQILYSRAAKPLPEIHVDQIETFEWFLANPDGSGQRSIATWNPAQGLSENFGDGVLSPDKSRLVWAGLPNIGIQAGAQIYGVSTAGGAPQRLTQGDNSENLYPQFNRDGTKITFVRSEYDPETNNDIRGNTDGTGEVYVMNADGSSSTRLTVSYSSNLPVAYRKVKLGGRQK